MQSTNVSRKNETDIALHDFLIEQNSKQNIESTSKMSRLKINSIDTLSSPSNYALTQANRGKPMSAASSSKYPLSNTTAPNSKCFSQSNLNSFANIK